MSKNDRAKTPTSIRADKTSREAFKITAQVQTSISQTIGDLRAGKDVAGGT